MDDIIVLFYPFNIFAYYKFKEKLLNAYKIREIGKLK
jgi:hypothetical protein